MVPSMPHTLHTLTMAAGHGETVRQRPGWDHAASMHSFKLLSHTHTYIRNGVSPTFQFYFQDSLDSNVESLKTVAVVGCQ